MNLLFVLLACNPEHHESTEKLEALEAAMQDFESWDHPADWPGIEESLDGTHGTHVQIWMDDAFLATLTDGGEMPTGAVAVKEGYDDAAGTDLRERVAHQRQSDGTLFFAVWDDAGVIENYGRPETCTDCHALGQDEVMAVTW